MGGKGSAPAPPDMTQIAEAQIESAEMWRDVSLQQLDWAKSMGERGMQLLNDVLGPQKEQLLFALENAKADRERYEQVFQPIEDNLIEEFQSYDSPERREQEAATRMADVRANYESQRQNAEQRLAGMGIDPSQLRGNALDREVRAQEAAMTAMAGNQGRKYVEQMGRALRGEAINIGRGLPSQVAQSQGIVNQTAGGMTGNFGNVSGATSGAYSGAMQAGQLANQGYQGGANTMNQGYQNRLSQWNANAQASGSLWGGLGELAGVGMMAYSDPKMKENVKKPQKGALKAIAETPSYEYDYKDSSGVDDGKRHIGPMAPDAQAKMGVGNGQALPLQDMLGMHQQALGEIYQLLETGGEVGDSFVIPKKVLDQEGRQKFAKLIEKWSGEDKGNG